MEDSGNCGFRGTAPEGAGGPLGALSGVRVLDFSRVLAGPYCTMILCDLGAEVIKVEAPAGGDDARSFPPFLGSESAYFAALNRGKKSVALDLKVPKAREVALELVKKSDVLVENFRPGTMERLGLGYEVAREANPRIVYASISGFGQEGPYRDRAGYDQIAQAAGGLMSVTGWPGSPPTRVGTAIADMLAGLNCCIGILCCLHARRLTGEGQRVDVALVDSVLGVMHTVAQIFFVEGRVPERTGNRNEFMYPQDTFKALDEYVMIAAGNDQLWQRLCEAMGAKELAFDERFSTNPKRVKNHEAVKEVVESWTQKLTARQVVGALTALGVPCAVVNDVRRAVEDEHLSRWREMVVEVPADAGRTMKVLGCPIKLSETPASIRRPAPRLGEHTEEVLVGVLQMTPEDIASLKRSGAIPSRTGGR